jgi:hypothetical protein
MSRFLDVLNATPLPDGLQWRLNADFRYESPRGLVAVPRNFVTDFASIPRIVWAILPPWGRYGAAAIIHDYLYWMQYTTRETADNTLREAMTLLGVDAGVITEVHTAVSAFGQGAWDHNAQLRASGYTRMSSGGDVPPYAGVPT